MRTQQKAQKYERMWRKYARLPHRVEQLLARGYTTVQIARMEMTSATTISDAVKDVRAASGRVITRGKRGYNYLREWHPDALREAMMLCALGDYDAARQLLLPLFKRSGSRIRLTDKTLQRWLKRAIRSGLI